MRGERRDKMVLGVGEGRSEEGGGRMCWRCVLIGDLLTRGSRGQQRGSNDGAKTSVHGKISERS